MDFFELIKGAPAEYLKQFAGVTALMMVCTEWLTPAWFRAKEKPARKRLAALVYAHVWSYGFYVLGWINIPNTIHDHSNGGWCQYFVLSLGAIGSTAMALAGHAVYKKVLKRPKDAGLPD